MLCAVVSFVGCLRAKNTSVYDNIGPVILAVSTLTLIYWVGSHMQVGGFVHFSGPFFYIGTPEDGWPKRYSSDGIYVC